MIASASFRFNALNEEQAEELLLLIPDADIGEHYETKDKVGVIKLVDSSLVVIIDEFRRKHSFVATDCMYLFQLHLINMMKHGEHLRQ